KLLLARDPLGIKPLYLAVSGGALVFASEMRSILASGLISSQIDAEGLTSYLAYGSAASPRTIIRNVRCLPPGSYQWITPEIANGVSSPPTRYWTFSRPQPVDSLQNACTLVRERVSQSVA